MVVIIERKKDDEITLPNASEGARSCSSGSIPFEGFCFHNRATRRTDSLRVGALVIR